MTKRLHGQAWRHALVLFRDGALGDVSDEQLVERFVNGQGELGEVAFEVLLERHGCLPVCRPANVCRSAAYLPIPSSEWVSAGLCRSVPDYVAPCSRRATRGEWFSSNLVNVVTTWSMRAKRGLNLLDRVNLAAC